MKQIFLLLVISSFSLNQSLAQCNADRHSTSWYDGWISCQTSPNPNSQRGNTHWILYDLGSLYSLSTTQLWNANDPAHLDYGVQEMIFDYSIDGTNWENLGTYSFSEASGKSTYEGNEGPDFNNVLARYVLLTPTANFGGSCYGFSEFKINIGNDVLTINPEIGFASLAYPNPFSDEVTVRVDTLFPDKPISYGITDLLGHTIIFKNLENLTGSNTFTLNNNDFNLATGIYLLSIYQGNQQQTIKIVKK